MNIPEQFTTIPNDYPAPTWENPGLYWNLDYLAYCERRDRGSHQRVQRGAVRVEQTPPAHSLTHTCEWCGRVHKVTPNNATTQRFCRKKCANAYQIAANRKARAAA